MVNKDRISDLPSDVLIFIICRLSLQEATSTCVLSTRWRHLHTYATHLNFPRFKWGVDTYSTYSKMVDHVLNSHRGTRIKEFRLGMPKGGNLERSFEFALSKKAEIIDLHGYCDIDYERLFLRLPNTNNGFECLKDLYLYGSGMTDQDFELLLSKCTALESLKLDYPIELNNVSIVGHSKLKHLDIFYLSVDSFVIRDAISLVSWKLSNLDNNGSLQLCNIPKLTELYFEAFHLELLDEFLTGMPSCIRDQLQIMHLSTQDYPGLWWVDLVNLKHLQLNLSIVDCCSCLDFLGLVRLVEACSSLDKLVIKFQPMLPYHKEDLLNTYVGPSELSLKYLEILQYSGSTSELAFTSYLIDSARSLKKVIVVAYNKEAARHDFRHITSVNILVM